MRDDLVLLTAVGGGRGKLEGIDRSSKSDSNVHREYLTWWGVLEMT